MGSFIVVLLIKSNMKRVLDTFLHHRKMSLMETDMVLQPDACFINFTGGEISTNKALVKIRPQIVTCDRYWNEIFDVRLHKRKIPVRFRFVFTQVLVQ
jgi:hypothetical protein